MLIGEGLVGQCGFDEEAIAAMQRIAVSDSLSQLLSAALLRKGVDVMSDRKLDSNETVSKPSRSGLKVIELVVILILACVVIALLLPAVQRPRRRGRSPCKNNLHQNRDSTAQLPLRIRLLSAGIRRR